MSGSRRRADSHVVRRVVSFNILSDDYVDFHDRAFMKKYYNGLDSGLLRWTEREALVLAKLQSLRADVFLLQEVMTEAREAIVREMGHEYYVGPLAYHEFPLDGINFNRTGNLILVRRRLCQRPPRFQSRPLGLGYSLASARVRWRVPHRVCRAAALWSVHLIDTPAKFGQLRTLLKELQSAPACDVIVGGDFNTQARSVHRVMRRHFFSSVRLDQALHHFGTYLCQKPMVDYIYTSLPARRARIDNSPLQSTRRLCFLRTLKELGSDHYPVVAEV